MKFHTLFYIAMCYITDWINLKKNIIDVSIHTRSPNTQKNVVSQVKDIGDDRFGCDGMFIILSSKRTFRLKRIK